MQKPETDEGPIEELSKKLYTPGESAVPPLHRAGFQRHEADVPEDWEHDHENPGTSNFVAMAKRHHYTVAQWVFGASLVFFLVAFVAAAFFLTGNRNILSTDKIDITVTGPVTIAAGDTLPLAIEVTNFNATTLEIADLIVEYPSGTRSPDDVMKELPRYRVGLGDIKPGGRVSTTTKAIVFGEERSKRDIIVTLEYRLAGSNAIFVKERAFTVTIGATPISLSVDAPVSINSGNVVEFELDVRSNSSVPMEDVVLRADYPFGFSFTEGSPEPSFSDMLWNLGDIEPEGKRKVRIRGTLEGQDEEERTFRFELGIASEKDTTTIGTSFVTAEHQIAISRPFVDLGLTLSGDADGVVVATPGGTVKGVLSWRNNLPVKMADVEVEIFFDGAALDERSVRSSEGFYDSADGALSWDRRTVPEFALLEQGARGNLDFEFATFPSKSLGGSSVNPTVTLTARITAKPVANEDTPELIRSEISRQVSLVTQPALLAAALHDTGPIDNSGPLPPVVEEKTTYTIQWTLTNSVNDVTNGSVRALLPPYISWEGVTSPATEEVVYDAKTGEVIWNVGMLKAGAGYSRVSRTAAFKIGLTPSVTQVGEDPVLINDAIFSGTDTFVGGEVGDTTTELTTSLEEPGFEGGKKDKVVSQ